MKKPEFTELETSALNMLALFRARGILLTLKQRNTLIKTCPRLKKEILKFWNEMRKS